MIFSDRPHAGLALAKLLGKFKRNAVVVAIPNGGAIVGQQVSSELNLPMEVLPVEKISIPENPHVILGAVAGKEVIVENFNAVADLKLSPIEFQYYAANAIKKQDVLAKKWKKFVAEKTIAKKTAIIVDDGISTGATIKAAIFFLLNRSPKQIIVAVPVAAPEVIASIKHEFPTIQFVTIASPKNFVSVSSFYKNFERIDPSEILAKFKTKLLH